MKIRIAFAILCALIVYETYSLPRGGGFGGRSFADRSIGNRALNQDFDRF